MKNNLFKYISLLIIIIFVIGGIVIYKQQLELKSLSTNIDILLIKNGITPQSILEEVEEDKKTEVVQARESLIENIKSISGEIKKINGDTLVIDAQIQDLEDFDPFNPEPVTTINKTIKVLISDETKFINTDKQTIKLGDFIVVMTTNSVMEEASIEALEISLVGEPVFGNELPEVQSELLEVQE